jgi:hypothetical protein
MPLMNEQVGRLMTEQRLGDARFPTLAVLMVPPATASTAWFALNGNRSTTVGVGLAAIDGCGVGPTSAGFVRRSKTSDLALTGGEHGG